MKTHPAHLLANGLWNPFTGRKKFQISCGEFNHTYIDKVPCAGIDEISSICPCCHTQNVWSISEWFHDYGKEFERLHGRKLS